MTSAEYGRRWREANPEKVAAYNAKRRVQPTKQTCTECGEEFTGRKGRLVCSRRCTDARFRRLHPEVYREMERRKHARRRAREKSTRA